MSELNGTVTVLPPRNVGFTTSRTVMASTTMSADLAVSSPGVLDRECERVKADLSAFCSGAGLVPIDPVDARVEIVVSVTVRET